MKNFEEWVDSYDDFEAFVGVNRLSCREVARKAWDYQQEKIDELQEDLDGYVSVNQFG